MLTEAQKDELDQRYSQFQQNGGELLSWEEVKDAALQLKHPL